MRRLVLAAILALVSLMTTGVLATPTHAQTTLPAVTVTPSTVAAGSSATVSGSGFTPNYYAFVYWQRPDGTRNGVVLTTNAAGQFSFTLGFLASHGIGTEWVAAYDYATGRWSPYTTVTVTSTSPPPAMGSVWVTPNSVTIGGTATLSGSGFTPNNYVFVYWQRPDGTTGGTWVYTSPNGTFSFTLGFLASHGCGTETLYGYNYATQMWSAPYAATVRGC